MLKDADTILELAVACQMDRPTNPSAVARHRHNVRRHGDKWYHDWTRTILQEREAFRDKAWVSSSLPSGSHACAESANIFDRVCTAAGDRVPGPRSFALLSPVEFPWRDSVDAIEEVGSKDSFTLSLSLCREGLIAGPSSGFNLQGKCTAPTFYTS